MALCFLNHYFSKITIHLFCTFIQNANLQCSDLSERFYFAPSATSVQTPFTDNISYRMQISTGGYPTIYKTSDKGSTWALAKSIITNADIDGIEAGRQESYKRTNMCITTPSGLRYQLLFTDSGTITIEKNTGTGWGNSKQIYP